jgi:hypothetical protein
VLHEGVAEREIIRHQVDIPGLHLRTLRVSTFVHPADVAAALSFFLCVRLFCLCALPVDRLL